MDNNISTWQTIQMRNYVKEIKKNFTKAKPTDWAILLNIVFLLVVFLLDKIYDSSTISKKVWIGILVVCLSIPSLVIIMSSQKTKSENRRKKLVLPPKEIVTLFDDEICYKLMSSISFCTLLKDMKTISSKYESSLWEFYFTEALYYLNKSISLLSITSNNLSEAVFPDQEAGTEKLSITRLENACDLIQNIYEDIIATSNKMIEQLGKNGVSVETQIATAKYYHSSFTEFYKRVEEISSSIQSADRRCN